MEQRPHTPIDKVRILESRLKLVLNEQTQNEQREGMLWYRFWKLLRNPDKSMWEVRGAMKAWVDAGNVRIKTGWLLERLRRQIPEARYAASKDITPQEEAEARRRLYILPSMSTSPEHTHYRRPGGRKPQEDVEHRQAYRTMERRYGSYKTRRGE